MKIKKLQLGFSLLEIMIVVVIIGIISATLVPRIIDKPDEARTQKAKSDIQAISSTLGLYKLDNFQYPTTNQGLDALVDKYLKKLPKDPWGNEYNYLSPGSRNSSFDLYSFGVNQRLGGGDDITNWE
jgi:general secretion pathway protein G